MNYTCLQTLFSGLALIVAIAAMFVACIIPKRIMLYQLYADLIAEYRSHDIGEAVFSVVDFYKTKCIIGEIDEIGDNYYKIYKSDFENKNKKNIRETLHFQRRILAQLYWQLDNCVSNHNLTLFKVSKKQFENDFPNNETNLLKIIYYMNKEVDKNKDIYTNIRIDKKLPNENDRNIMNKHIYALCEKFENRRNGKK
jgi:hypothetical protein